jgi:hypothetical protein
MAELEKQAINYIKENENKLCKLFCDRSIFKMSQKPLTFFMAGSPGAGKTESSKIFIEILEETFTDIKIVRIDADEIREHLPGYTGSNSHIFQSACNLAVTKLIDHVMKFDQHCIIDGTLSSYNVAKNNIQRSLKHGRHIWIYYIYQDPIRAWEFTKKREKIEGRKILKNVFIKAFINARANVIALKKEFNEKLSVIVEVKQKEKKPKFYFNSKTIDLGTKDEYTIGSLARVLKD